MKCPSCGVENKPSKTVCRKCGAPLVNSSKAASSKIENADELYKRISLELRKIFISLSITFIIILTIYFLFQYFI